jgi:hypothetical protein
VLEDLTSASMSARFAQGVACRCPSRKWSRAVLTPPSKCMHAMSESSAPARHDGAENAISARLSQDSGRAGLGVAQPDD